MTRRGQRLVMVIGLWLGALPLAAQTHVADSLWAAGKYPEARAAYTQVLHENPGSVRALFRLAILEGWDGNLDSALALLRDAREVEPKDPDVRLWEAKILAWNGDYRGAVARYDSLIAENPDQRDPRFGRAQALAWWGRYTEADRALRALLEKDPKDTEALVALARLRMWQGRPEEADRYNGMALLASPQDPDALKLEPELRALRRPDLEATFGLAHDSDHNTVWWQSLGTSLLIGPGLRGFATVGSFEAGDPLRSGTRVSAEAGATLNRGDGSVTAAVGVRKLSADSGFSRALATIRLGASYRLASWAGVDAGFAHYTIDETAFLLSDRLDINEVTADADAVLAQRLTLGVGGGLGYLSDNNHRRSLVLALTERLNGQLTVGAYGRGLWYDFRGNGYFSPDRFLLGEARGTYARRLGRWEGRLAAGLGIEEVANGAGTEAEWHGDLRIARHWGVANELALSGGISNSAISSATGAYHYYTGAVSVRVGL